MFDSIYRLVLSPDSLYESRRSTQSNDLKRTLDNTLSVSERCVRSKINSVPKSNNDDNSHNSDMDSFVNNVIMNEKNGTPSIVGIKAGGENENAVILLAVKSNVDSDDRSKSSSGSGSSSTGTSYERIVEYPLVKFGNKLAEAFENKLTSTTLCFIADASSGLGSEILGSIAACAGTGLVSSLEKRSSD